MRDALGVLAVVAGIAGAILAYNSLFYTTGTEWYEACWAKKQAHTSFATEPVAPDADTDIDWKNCERIAQKAFYDQGMVFSGLPKDSSDQRGIAMKNACPNTWSDIPLAGFYMKAVDVVQAYGGPSFLDRFLPADILLGRAFDKQWPTCASVRASQGYPMIKEVAPGKFDWAEKCIVCTR